MAFSPENELERCLMEAPSDPIARMAFFRLLLDSDLYVIGQFSPRPPGEGGPAPEEGEWLMLASVSRNDRRYHPVFSSLTRARAFTGKDGNYLPLNGRGLFEHTLGSYFVLNPGSDFGKELSPDEIANLLSPAFAPADAAGDALPADAKSVVTALKLFFARKPEILSAHMIEFAFGASGAPQSLIGVETTGDWRELWEEARRVAKSANPAAIVDIMQINRNDSDSVTATLLKTPPFYTRARST